MQQRHRQALNNGTTRWRMVGIITSSPEALRAEMREAPHAKQYTVHELGDGDQLARQWTCNHAYNLELAA